MPSHEIYDIGTEILYETCDGHNSTQKARKSIIPEDFKSAGHFPSSDNVKSRFKAIAVSPTLRPKLAPELSVPGYSGVVVRPCVCLVCVSFVGVCVLIVVVTCSMMVFPFISSAFPFGMGCIWVCRWPLWESV